MSDAISAQVIALGFFDGIHIGHAALIQRAKERAAELGCTPAVLTFDIHPDQLVSGVPVPLINSSAGRLDILERLFGIRNVIIVHFDDQLRKMPWDTFLCTLRERFGAVHLIAGHDYRFGYKGQGTAARLREKCAELGLGSDIIPAVVLDGVEVSSTHIRKLIAEGQIEEANRFLGHPHTLVDTVRFGYKFGRTIGAPTINMMFPDGVLIPAFGVYAAKVCYRGRAHNAVTNIGIRPTVGGREGVTVESFILDFHDDLYGREVRVDFHKFLRPEIRFDDVGDLKAQIQKDKDAARAYFSAL